jgi:hypothetical protein
LSLAAVVPGKTVTTSGDGRGIGQRASRCTRASSACSRFAIARRWATLAWHGNWLLYSVTGGKTLLLETATRARPLDLTRLVHELVSHSNLRSIVWA